MPQTPHIERHFPGTATVRDIVIGMADGLTVPFALAAGLAEIAVGLIAMGLGGYLAAQGDAEHCPPNGSARKQRLRRKKRPRSQKSLRSSSPTASPRTKAGQI
jgi:hypothetical protein